MYLSVSNSVQVSGGVLSQDAKNSRKDSTNKKDNLLIGEVLIWLTFCLLNQTLISRVLYHQLNVKVMKKVIIVAFLAIFSALNLQAQEIKQNIEEQETPSKPDYSQERYWSALPWRVDAPDEVPNDEEYKDRQDIAVVDVFFVHPTTLTAKDGVWNADVNNEKLNQKVDKLPVKHQASVFNGSARVFAPRYRQANYEAFMTLGTNNSNQALLLAYQDVREAFLYYLENYNEGRPFIIAGHSQGTFHAIELVKEFIDTTALLEKMVSAYLVGMPVNVDDFQNCKPCEEMGETNCFVTWNTMKKKSYPKFYKEYFQNAVCHNPLSWEMNEYYCEAECHQGMVPREFKKLVKKQYGAKVHQGILWVDAVKIPGIPFTKLVKNWHIGDYNLFYGNIRENVNFTVENYLIKNKLKQWEIVNLELEVK